LTAALLRYSYARGWAEPATWASALLERLEEEHPAALASAAALACDAAIRDDFLDAQRLAEKALSSADPRVVASALETLADVGMYVGDVDLARRHGAVLFDMGERSGDTSDRTLGMLAIVLSDVYAGNPERGQTMFDQLNVSLDLAPTSEAWIAYAHGELRAAAGRTDEAVEAFGQAIELGTSVGSDFVVGVARVSSLAVSARSGRDPPAAFLPLLEEYRRTQNLTHAITALRNLVEAMVAGDMTEPAMVLLGALSNPDVKSTYGAESDRIVATVEAAIAATGATTVEEWIQEGRSHNVAWALDHAIDVLSQSRSPIA
jgi:tetratricopeptide (TPR) repeat protein